MFILAIDTSAKTASVALLSDDSVMAELFLGTGKNHEETLLPAISSLLSFAKIKMAEIDAFALTVGPGSFTGLRVGMGVVKGLALATGKPVVGVSALDALALNASGSSINICPVLDAGRESIYTALYRPRAGGVPERIIEERIVSAAEFLEGLGEDTLFLGYGSRSYAELINKKLQDKASIALPYLNDIRASAVGFMGLKKICEDDILDIKTAVPRYLHSSYAKLGS